MKAAYIDHMGSDLRVVNAARVSFKKESTWDETYVDSKGNVVRVLSEKDQRLIKYLADHNHFTPFTHCMVTVREWVPIFVARQRFKHTVGFSYNEVSRRYVDDTPELYQPKEWRGRSKNAKQGSSDEVMNDAVLDVGEGPLAPTDVSDAVYWSNIWCLETYEALIRTGVAPEQARMVLPQSMYTEYYVTGSLAAWARAYQLRSDPHAQKEIQELAAQWNDILGSWFPVSWKALTSQS